jgi:DNA replication protein
MADQDWSIKGFSSSGAAIPVPDRFFSEVLPRVNDLNELKISLYVFWLIKHKKGYPRFVTPEELLNYPALAENLDCMAKSKEQSVNEAVALAVRHGILLAARININGVEKQAIFFNMEPDRAAFQKLVNGDLKVTGAVPVTAAQTSEIKNIYALYEGNIGIITPIVAEELKRAEEEYPAEWIEEAFKNAVEMNKRNWRYISRILEIWSSEGKDDGKTRGYIKKDKDSGKYVRGKYGHMVNR